MTNRIRTILDVTALDVAVLGATREPDMKTLTSAELWGCVPRPRPRPRRSR